LKFYLVQNSENVIKRLITQPLYVGSVIFI
jgi:hypothetical protein